MGDDIDMNFNIEHYESDNIELEHDEIFKVESILGFKLPKSYIDLMFKWNGGYLDVEYVSILPKKIPNDLKYYLSDGVCTVSAISGLSSDINNENGIIYTAQTAHEWGVNENIIAFSGDGHTWLAFDYRNKQLAEPTIIYIETDNGSFLKLANDFDSYLRELIPADNIYDEEGNIHLD